MKIHEMVTELLSIRLGDSVRSRVLGARDEMRAHGHVKPSTRADLRKIYNRNRDRLEEYAQARERGKVAMFLEQKDLSRVEIEHPSEPDQDDFGF